MRLCFISNPNSTHTRRWVNWFVKRGYTISLVADIPLQEPWPEVHIIDLSRIIYAPVIRFPIWAIWLKYYLRQWGADILHAHRVNSAGWVAAASGFHPLVVTPWGSDLYRLPHRSPVERWLARFVLQRGDLITADAEDLLHTARHYGADPARMALIQWGVDLSFYHPGQADTNLRTRLGLEEGPVVLSPRAINTIYNIDIILRAMVDVCRSFPTAKLILRDYNTDQAYKGGLEELITSLGLAESVRWLGRVEPWERLADIYRLADVAVSVTSSDSTPVSVLEAMACGVPVITTDLPALHEWITPGENGMMVPQRDPQALAQAICQILNSPELAARFRTSGLSLVVKRADHQLEMQKMEKLYQSLLQDFPKA